MNEDLKKIKKLYGEKMMHFCRDNLASVLESPGLLPKILEENFYPHRALITDVINYHIENEFKDYIYSKVEYKYHEEKQDVKPPKELLEEAGYTLYECHTEEEIQSFKKYYALGEELCTFKGGRLDRCHVFFAVKKDVDNIKREDFTHPLRQDAYGTSVISIQFTKDEAHTLSIKNRYNHTVMNPDATFSNDLDNIIAGLTDSFAIHYGLIQQYPNKDFELTQYVNYVKASDGRYYKYNYELYNNYYCPDNIIINNFKPIEFSKERYIIADYFIIDLQEKTITLFDYMIDDSFYNIKYITKMEVKTNGSEKIIYITYKRGKKIEIHLNENNQIIRYKNNNIEKVGNYFLAYNTTLTEIELNNAKVFGNMCFWLNLDMEELTLPNATYINSAFLRHNKKLRKLITPKLVAIGYGFLEDNTSLEELEIPKRDKIIERFFSNNEHLKAGLKR